MTTMSEFSPLCNNVNLWDPTTKAIWGSLDFCPRIRQFVVPALTHTQLTKLSQAEAWVDIENPRCDIAFLMKAPSANIGGKQIFGLAVVWAHPHQGHLTTLVGVACKLALLMDDGLDWHYAFVCMSSTTHHVPFSDAGHIGTMTDGTWSVNACGHLNKLQTWKLLQHREHVVFPEGLNGELEACHFSFPELPPWDTTTAGRSAGELSPIELTLGGAEHESMLAIPHSPVNLTPVSHHNTLGKKLPYEALGHLPPSQWRDPLSLEETDSPFHVPMATQPPGIPGQHHPGGLFCLHTSQPFTIPGHCIQIPRSSQYPF